MPDVALCILTDEALDVAACYQSVRDPKFGGVVVFTGEVRSITGEAETQSLTYEAYQSMALAQMRLIAKAASLKYGARVAVAHRTGFLEPGEVAVVCAAAAPHRDAAFACARELIDQIKADVPIWKKEPD